MLYPSELLARSRRSSKVQKGATSGNCREQLYSIWYAYSIWMNEGLEGNSKREADPSSLGMTPSEGRRRRPSTSLWKRSRITQN